MLFYHSQYEAIRELSAVQRHLTEALILSNRPHLLGAAVVEMNAALRRLAQAQHKAFIASRKYQNEERERKKKEQ
jgi:hypothetical protein